MSYPYPQDRHLDRKEKGAQPYQDAKEALTLAAAKLPIKTRFATRFGQEQVS